MSITTSIKQRIDVIIKAFEKRVKLPKSWASPYYFDKRLKLFNEHFEVGASMRASNSFMGRFGGGWQWELGFQTGSLSPAYLKEYGFTLILNLLVMTVRINYRTDKCITRDKKYEEERKQREKDNGTIA